METKSQTQTSEQAWTDMISRQDADLDRWSHKLKPEVLADIFYKVKNSNSKAQTPNDICRGTAITELVVNYDPYIRHELKG